MSQLIKSSSGSNCWAGLRILGKKLSLSCALSALALTSSYPAWAAGGKTIPALQLKQVHYFLGDQIVTAADNAVRIENCGGMKYVVVARAPDWTIYIFRNDDKTYFTESLKQFEETGLVSDFLVSRRQHIRDPQGFYKTPMKYLGYDVIRMTGPGRSYKIMKVPKGMAPQVEMIIYSTYKLSTWGCIPVEETGQMTNSDYLSSMRRGTAQTYLRTTSIKSVNVAPDIFELPKNYKRVKSSTEVTAGNKIREDSRAADELFEMGGHRNK